MGYMISRDGLKSIKLLSRTCLGQQLSLKLLAFLVLSTIDNPLELESLDRTQALKDTPERFHDDLFFRNGQ